VQEAGEPDLRANAQKGHLRRVLAALEPAGLAAVG
jgi:hypothetical protein